MASILVVCTGNICRSPMAEGFLRAEILRRDLASSITVASCGTWGWEGSPAIPESVEAAAERGADISSHIARRISPAMVDAAVLVLGLTEEHCAAAVEAVPAAASRTFTVKELALLADELPAFEQALEAHTLEGRVAAAHELRDAGFEGNPLDMDVVDPLGLAFETYKAVAWEIDELCGRIADGLLGRAPAGAPAGAPARAPASAPAAAVTGEDD